MHLDAKSFCNFKNLRSFLKISVRIRSPESSRFGEIERIIVQSEIRRVIYNSGKFYEPLFCDSTNGFLQVGPDNPFKTKHQKASKNTLTGFVEGAHVSEFHFETERRTFDSYGKQIFEVRYDFDGVIKNGWFFRLCSRSIGGYTRRRRISGRCKEGGGRKRYVFLLKCTVFGNVILCFFCSRYGIPDNEKA